MSTLQEERKLIRISVMMSLLFCSFLVITFLFQLLFRDHLYTWGIWPRQLEGLPGILFAPLLHAGWGHLLGNLWSLFFLLTLSIYSFRAVAYRTLGVIWLADGLGVWLIGRNDTVHFGASGLVYGLAGFLFLSGMIRKNNSLRAMAIIVVFLHWGFLWGMNPMNRGISWEAHLCGFLSGAACSLWYIRKGPPDDPVPEWMREEIEAETGAEFWHQGKEEIQLPVKEADDSSDT